LKVKIQTSLLIFLFLINALIAETKKDIIKLNVIQHNKISYISISEFAQQQNLKYSYYTSKEKLELQYKQKKLYFSPRSSYMKVDEKSYHLTYETLYKNKTIYVPAKTFLKVLEKELLPIQLLELGKKDATIMTNIYNIHNLNIKNKKNGLAITLKTSKKFPNNSIATSINAEGWLNITILGGKADSLGIKQSKLINPVIRSHIIQSNQSTQISLLIKTKVDRITSISENEKIELLIHTQHQNNVSKIEQLRKNWKIDTIVLDAGHGGKDPGAIGINKLQEKTVTLDIAKQLTKMLERNLGVKVVNTRNEDIFIPLWKRTQIANKANGDIFISIHANSTSKSSSINGFETFLLRVGKTDEAIEVAKRENSVITLEEKSNKYKDLSDTNLILATMSQNSNMKSSEDLAATIQHNLAKRIKFKNRGVKQAGFHVLVGASMPNVLIEVGFLSNKNEANQLGKSSYRREIAKAIYEAILDYKVNNEK